MMKRIALFSLALALMISLSACLSPADKVSEKVGESMAERAIENATGGAADVDVDNENVTIKTDEGSFEAGENVKLPDDFPSDVYVYDGKLQGVIRTNENKGFTLTIETVDTVATVKAVYEEKMREAGWETAGSMDFGTSASLGGEKDGRTLSVIIGEGDAGKSNVILTVAEEESATAE
jgi:hypothetical protein